MAEPIMAQPRSGQPPSRLIYFSPSVYWSSWTNPQLSQPQLFGRTECNFAESNEIERIIIVHKEAEMHTAILKLESCKTQATSIRVEGVQDINQQFR